MKNTIILTTLLSSICSAGFTMHSVDFSQDQYFCNGTLLTQNSDAPDVSPPPSLIIETITFNADDGSSMKYAYVGTQLQSCKTSAGAKKPF